MLASSDVFVGNLQFNSYFMNGRPFGLVVDVQLWLFIIKHMPVYTVQLLCLYDGFNVPFLCRYGMFLVWTWEQWFCSFAIVGLSAYIDTLEVQPLANFI